ncbi:MAG: VOC family protein [Bacteroidetes bacterium]|nr:VOC family protein [Bacteroidota bacterium]
MDLNQVTLPATDMDASSRFYSLLGLTLIVESPEYLRFECPDGDSTFSLHKADRLQPDPGTSIYFECSDLDEKVEYLRQQGISFELLPTDQSWLWREARLKDPAGNQIILYFAGKNRKNPPWRIENVNS